MIKNWLIDRDTRPEMIDIKNLKRDVYDKVLPPMNPKYRKNMLEDMRMFGYRNHEMVLAVKVNNDIIVVDGHNRCDIALEAGYANVPVLVLSAQDEIFGGDIESWIKRNALSKRNLSDHDQKIFMAILMESEKQKLGNYKKHQSDVSNAGSTAQKLANELGVSRPTIERSQQYKKGFDAVKERLGEDVAVKAVDDKIISAKELEIIGKEKSPEKKEIIKNDLIEKVEERRVLELKRLNFQYTERKDTGRFRIRMADKQAKGKEKRIDILNVEDSETAEAIVKELNSKDESSLLRDGSPDISLIKTLAGEIVENKRKNKRDTRRTEFIKEISTPGEKSIAAPRLNSFSGIFPIFKKSIEACLKVGNLDKLKCCEELKEVIDYCTDLQREFCEEGRENE